MPTFASVSSNGSRALPAVAQVVAQWAHDDPWQLVAETASRKDLALLASTLWACAPPPGADFGLGLVVAFDAFERRDRGDVQSAVVHDREIAGLEGGDPPRQRRRGSPPKRPRRATAQELRDERRARRTREENAEAETQAAYRHAEGVESQLRQAEVELEAERARVATRAATGACIRRGSAQGARRARRPDDARCSRRLRGSTPRDALELADVTAAMQRLAVKLESLRARVETSSEMPPRLQRRPPASGLARRASPDRVRPRRCRSRSPGACTPRIPGGVVAESPIGIETMLQSARVVLVIDGYNVTKRALARRDAGRPAGTPGRRASRS